jgi:DNA polymerase-3 subunit beta
MSLSLQRETLLAPLQSITSVVERKQTLPILGNVLIKAEGNTFSMTATDLEIELISTALLHSPVPEPIQLTVPAHKLLEICKTLPEQAILKLAISPTRVTLTSDRSRFILATLPVEHFPCFQSEKQDITTHNYTIKQKTLSALLQRTYFAMAQQDVRYQLNGMLLDIQKDKLSAIATDGHRFAMNTTPLDAPDTSPTQTILPRKTALELARLLKTETDDIIHVSVSENNIQFVTDSFTLTSKLIDGKFPNYTHLFPKEIHTTISIDRDALREALFRAAVLSNEKFRFITLKLTEGWLHIFANNTHQEEAEESISIEYQGQPFDVIFNLTYLLDVLNTVSTGLVDIKFFAAKNRIIIEEQKDHTESTFLIMPLQV